MKTGLFIFSIFCSSVAFAGTFSDSLSQHRDSQSEQSNLSSSSCTNFSGLWHGQCEFRVFDTVVTSESSMTLSQDDCITISTVSESEYDIHVGYEKTESHRKAIDYGTSSGLFFDSETQVELWSWNADRSQLALSGSFLGTMSDGQELRTVPSGEMFLDGQDRLVIRIRNQGLLEHLTCDYSRN